MPGGVEDEEIRWERLTILEQMGNIGSEVGRTLKLKQRGDDFECVPKINF